MKKSESFNGNSKLNDLILSKDSFLIEDEELYQLIKDKFHEKQTYKALRFVKPYLYISNFDNNLNHQMKKESLDKNKRTQNSFSHLKIEDSPTLNIKKIKNFSKNKNRNNIPLPNIKTDTSINLKKSSEFNGEINNIITITENNNDLTKSKSKTRSYSANNYSLSSTIKKKRINEYEVLNPKISLNKLLSLRARFFANENMNRGELTEMMFGNKIPFYTNKNKYDDMQNKNKVYEVLCNNPKLIIDLIEKGYVDKKDIIDYFNIKSINLHWNDKLEKKFREISYNKRKTNSNMLKTTFFLVNIGFHRILKEKFEEKNFRNTSTYNQKEIEEFAKMYEKLRKYDLNKLLEGYSKVDAIYHLREVIINDKINKIRDNYYHNKLNKFFHDKNKTEIILQNVVQKEKNEMKEMKNTIFQIRENKEWKNIPNKKINKLKLHKSITKINRFIKEDVDIKNVYVIDKIKLSKKYIKEKIKLLKKQRKFPSLSSPNNFKFDWKLFMNENIENKKIIKYCIVMIQSMFRGFMVKVFVSNLIRSIDIIINNLGKYIEFKKLVLKLYNKAFNEIEIKKNDNFEFRESIKELRKKIKFIIKNNKSRKLLFKKNEIDLINRLEESNIDFKPIKEEQPIYSVKLLLILDKYLFYLYHGYI